MIPDRVTEVWDDLRWGIRRGLNRRRVGRLPRTREQVIRRRRSAALVGLVLALYAVFRFVPLPALSCDVSPAKSCTTGDEAIAMVPANATAYLHVDLDRDAGQVSGAEEVAGRLPHSEQILQGIFAASGVAPDLSLRDDIGPWIGEEAAIAALGRGDSQPLVLLAIGDERGARRFAGELGDGRPRRVGEGGRAFRLYDNDVAFARARGFLVIGTAAAVKAALAAGDKEGGGLSDSKRAASVRDSLPDRRFADLYLSAGGIDEFLAGRSGLGSQLDTFVDFDASRGVAAALVATDDGFEVRLHSALDPERTQANPNFFQAFPSFDPGLAAEFSPDTLLYLEIGDPSATVRALLRQAAAAAPSLVEAFNSFEGELARSGVDIERGLLPVLGDDAAVGVELAPAPYLTFVLDDVDEDRAREQMARLQVPLVAALSPEQTGQAPDFEAERIGDVVTRSVRLSPTLTIAYAIFDGKLVVSTDPAGVRQAVEGNESLADSNAFKAATGGASGGTSALVFLSLESLVRRSEPLGLDQIVRGFAEDISSLKGLGLSVRSDEESLDSTLSLDIE